MKGIRVETIENVRKDILELCKKFPLYPEFDVLK